MSRWTTRLLLIPLICLIGNTGCLFSPDDKPPEPDPPPAVPFPDTPENVLRALEVIYRDTIRNATERRTEYENLFPPLDDPELTFVFQLQPGDVIDGLPASWGRDLEIQLHENMFKAQERRDIFSLTLAIQNDPAEELEFPLEGQEDWREVNATSINLRLLFNPDDGLEVTNGRAVFRMAPGEDDQARARWYLVEWEDRESAG